MLSIRIPFRKQRFRFYKPKWPSTLQISAASPPEIARQSQSDIISARDVEAACQRLTVSPRTRMFRHLGTFAGLALVFALSNVGSMVVANQYPPIAMLVTLAAAVIGAFCLGIHMRND